MLRIAFDHDHQRTPKPTVIDDARDRPTLAVKIIVSDDDEGQAAKITAGDLDLTMAGPESSSARKPRAN